MVLSRYSKSFVHGVVIGCAVVTLLLITSTFVSKEITRSLESIYGGETETLFLAERRSLLFFGSMSSQAADGAGRKEEVTTLVSEEVVEEVHDSTVASSGASVKEDNEEFHQPLKPLLSVVVTSRYHVERTSRLIKSTWGNNTMDYCILIGMDGNFPPFSTPLPHVYESPHTDFPAVPYLTLEELGFVLNLVRSNFLNNYKWFLIVSSNVYVSVQRLERFLGGLESNSIVYLGHPSNQSMEDGKYYCEGGPGILLSHTALRFMEGQIQECQKTSGKKSGYLELGKCFISRLHQECNHGGNMQMREYFIHDKTVLSLRAEALWNNKMFEKMLTLYPIHDKYHMATVHAFNQAREIAYHQEKALEIQNKLENMSLCLKYSSELCILSPVMEIETDYVNFTTKHCRLFSRTYKPEMRRKVVNWDTISGSTLYNSWDLDPQTLVHGDLSKELQYVTEHAVSVVKEELPNARLHRMANMHVRYMGSKGKEYLFDMELKETDELIEKRVSLLLPHHPNMILKADAGLEVNVSSLQLNFIVPLNGLNRPKIARFQRSYFNLCVKKKENCRIIYVLFSNSINEKKFMGTYLKRFQHRHNSFLYELVNGVGEFNLTKAYNLGMSQLEDNELGFIATLDLSTADHFLNRCRRNTVRGTRIYYPEIFRYYNMNYVFGKRKWRPRHYDYTRLNGHWTTNGVACIYKSDYIAIGGYNAITQWEMEPSLMHTYVHGSCEVMRAPDPGISHWYEVTKCNSSLPSAQFSSCLSTRSDNLADRLSLAGYLLSLEGKCNYKNSNKRNINET